MREWIRIKEKSAPLNETILLTDGKKVFAGYKYGNEEKDYTLLYADVKEIEDYILDENGCLIIDVSHWLPLPELLEC